MNAQLGWFLVVGGIALSLVGLTWIFAPGLPLGRLPGDIRIENGNTRIYIPLATCLLLSLVLSAVAWLVRWVAR